MDAELIINEYVKESKRFPLLSIDDEIKLYNIMRYSRHQHRKAGAREKLIMSNLRLVLKMAYKLHHNDTLGMEMLDVINAGNVGLAKAADMYNYRKFKTRFSTYAVGWIKQAILSDLYQGKRRIYVPSHINEQARKMEKSRDGRNITDTELRKQMGLSRSNFIKVKGSRVSVVPIITEGLDKDGSPGSTEIPIIDHNTILPDKAAIISEHGRLLRSAIELLPKEEGDIITQRYLKIPPMKLEELGEKQAVSGERIRQREESALEKLKWILKRKDVAL